MKRTFTRTFIACTCFTLFAAKPYMAAATVTEPVTAIGTPEDKKPGKKTRLKASRRNQAVKIYPDPVKRMMHVVARVNDGKQVDLFVFDLQGTLMHHLKMESGAHAKIAGLQKGKYVYSVFSGDEEIATSRFEMR